MGRPSRETIMQALLQALTSALQASFTADTQKGSQILLNVSSTAGLMIGMPVIGTGVPVGALITQVSPLTLNLPATANQSQQSFDSGVQTTGRRVIPWGDCTDQPALFLRDTDERLEYTNTLLQTQTIKAEVWLYNRSGGDKTIAPITGLNNMLDAVQAAIAPDDPQGLRYTIGGLVFWARMIGRVEKDPGDMDDGGQSVAVADIEILVP